MNRQRRKRLGDAFNLISQAKDILEKVKDEEQDSYDNLPENFQYGNRGKEMHGYIEMLDEAYGYLDDTGSVLEQI